jgi:hypothetical protein
MICQECNKINKFTRSICAECGSDLSFNFVEEVQPAMDYFKNEREVSSLINYGVLYTDFAALSQKMDRAMLESLIAEFIYFFEKKDLKILVLDASENRIENLSHRPWEAHVKLLKKSYDELKRYNIRSPRFLFILGSNDVIPQPVVPYHKYVESPDINCDSDLPYAILKSSNFESNYWELKDLDYFNEKWALGRLPVLDDVFIANYFSKVYSFFSSTQNHGKHGSGIYGLSDEEWKGLSFGVLNDISKNVDLHISPPLNLESVDECFDQNAEFYYFNLHGSNSQQYWSSRWGGNVISSSQISEINNFNFVGVEACYGALMHPENFNKNNQFVSSETTLVNALGAKTIAFVGSSRIAWGSSEAIPPILFADLIIHMFLKAILVDGLSSGAAFINARKACFLELVKHLEVDNNYFIQLATIAQFNLYGIPFALGSEFIDNNWEDSFVDLDLTLPSIELPEIYSEVVNEVDEQLESIITTLGEKIRNEDSWVSESKPKIIKFKNTISFSFCKEKRYVIYTTDYEGNIMNKIYSK